MNKNNQSVLDTFESLRRHLIEVGILLFAFSLIGWLLSEDVQARLSDYAGNQLAYYRVEEAFFTKVKLSVCIGLFLAFPSIAIKVWNVFAKKNGLTGLFLSIAVLGSSILLFASGTFLCYAYSVPFGIDMLIGFGGGYT